VLTAANQEWAIDFASDVAASGQRLRIFSVVDSYTRERLALEVDTSMPPSSTITDGNHRRAWSTCGDSKRQRSRDELAALSGMVHRKTKSIRFTSNPPSPHRMRTWRVSMADLRDECLNVSWFWNLLDARKIRAWRADYNGQRPHSALGYLTPQEFAARLASPSEAPHIARPDLPQGCPDGSAVAVAPAPALTQIQPREEILRRRRSESVEVM